MCRALLIGNREDKLIKNAELATAAAASAEADECINRIVRKETIIKRML